MNKGICESIGPLEGHLDCLRNDPHTYLLPTNMVNSKKTWSSSYCLCLDGSTLFSLLNPGTNLLANLTELLLRFRSKPYTVQLDSKEAYFQVLVHPNDRKLLRFLHRPQRASQPEVLESTRLVMGVADSQNQMVSCLHVTSDKIRPTKPAVAELIENFFYSDDGILAFHNEEEAIETTKKLVGTLTQYGFLCHKFSSNSKKVMEPIPEILRGWDAIKSIGRRTKNSYPSIIRMKPCGGQSTSV